MLDCDVGGSNDVQQRSLLLQVDTVFHVALANDIDNQKIAQIQ